MNEQFKDFSCEIRVLLLVCTFIAAVSIALVQYLAVYTDAPPGTVLYATGDTWDVTKYRVRDDCIDVRVVGPPYEITICGHYRLYLPGRKKDGPGVGE